MSDLSSLENNAMDEIQSAGDMQALESLRVQYLGKKGVLTEQLKSLGKLPKEERPEAGQKINQIKVVIQEALEERKGYLHRRSMRAQQKLVVKIKSVMHCTRWMMFWNVECLKIVKLIFNLRAFFYYKTKLFKVILYAVKG